MANYGQFCSIARAHEVLGGRWTLLIVREILCGSQRFNDIRRGIPRISRTVLSERLQALLFAGAITRVDGAHGPEYALTEAGRELAILVGALGAWGQRWLKREAKDEDLDFESAVTADEWNAFVRAFKAEMDEPTRRRTLDLLSALSHGADFSIGCYCENEARCHRSVLRELLTDRGATIG